jgi:hypothetical protein
MRTVYVDRIVMPADETAVRDAYLTAASRQMDEIGESCRCSPAVRLWCQIHPVKIEILAVLANDSQTVHVMHGDLAPADIAAARHERTGLLHNQSPSSASKRREMLRYDHAEHFPSR